MVGESRLLQTEKLLEELRQGSDEAFAAIFRAYHGRVFAVAYRLVGSAQEAEDIAQEVFLRLYLRPLPTGREHNLAGWLLKVATNLAYNSLRSRQRREAREGQGLAQWPEEDEAAEGSGPAPDSEAAELVRATLAALPERQVQLLLLRQAGLSYAELAAALGVAAGSIGTLLARAERAFRETYEREGQ
jgi:RNA polymerase sigma-70 factor (ECF subfamily)